ncbi:hypothetical protein M9H77_18683 [Catharanthus roseus]|uniref:Uncharacterized protein n=1 Tax=Catharanthus roseus TaxID=4058 RepID=A0ACC0B8C3_CATRO|nr:hypothetical protein M9H77_18683 [Catharanthus roseus]
MHFSPIRLHDVSLLYTTRRHVSWLHHNCYDALTLGPPFTKNCHHYQKDILSACSTLKQKIHHIGLQLFAPRSFKKHLRMTHPVRPRVVMNNVVYPRTLLQIGTSYARYLRPFKELCYLWNSHGVATLVDKLSALFAYSLLCLEYLSNFPSIVPFNASISNVACLLLLFERTDWKTNPIKGGGGSYDPESTRNRKSDGLKNGRGASRKDSLI